MPPSLRAVIILAGTNNIEANGPLAVCAGVHTLIKEIQADRPGLLVGILGVLPRKPGPSRGLTEMDLMSRVRSLNQGLQGLARMPSVVYEDACSWHELCDSSPSRKGLMNERFFADCVHLNSLGYRVLTAAILRLMANLCLGD